MKKKKNPQIILVLYRAHALKFGYRKSGTDGETRTYRYIFQGTFHPASPWFFTETTYTYHFQVSPLVSLLHTTQISFTRKYLQKPYAYDK